MEQKKEALEIQLFSSSNEYEINQICALLTENNIPYVRNDYGSGSYMNLYMGQSIQEKTIFVHKNDYDKSLDLISYLIPNNVTKELESGLVEEMGENQDASSQNKYKNIKRSFGFLVLAILGLPTILMIIMTILSLL